MIDSTNIRERTREIEKSIAEMKIYLGVDKKRLRLAELEKEASQPSFWDNPDIARLEIEKANAIRGILDPLDALLAQIEDLNVMLELANESASEEEMDQAVKEAASVLKQMELVYKKFELEALLGDPLDQKNAYLSLHAGAGGTESCDWAEMLFRMYARYIERAGYKLQVLDSQPGDEAGLKSITFQVSGPRAYGYLKGERGVHRLVRISPFDSQSRRHTSFAALDIMPELEDDLDVKIEDSDLRVDTYRASGAGGQHVNTTDSAIRIVHLPSGIVVQCQAERSQHKNRSTAMKILRSKIYEMERDKKRKDVEQLYGNKGEITWGSQIRSYVLQPYTMAKDHRTNLQIGNVEGVLDGDIEPFIEAYLKMKKRED